jgi:hypothetical protein
VILIGCFLIALGTFPFLAPIYLFSLLLNWNRAAGEQEPAEEQNIQP